MRLIMMPFIASNSSDSKRIAELQAYAADHIPPSARQAVKAAAATVKARATFKTERLPEINGWLSGSLEEWYPKPTTS